ncbi:head GIN domain-containing protein [Paludibacterium paludis]|uniref:DUF2807 domain-containing protein n=1 Tax=Paludibacterium paludis TaxID=1225769 RepID=A0A918P680_9NEIS|nr:head GIN domain-containing protein [Paludibacterium paludis]GGY26614.1 DUF2807 domain-containing protein [Paludibacterium paludis]
MRIQGFVSLAGIVLALMVVPGTSAAWGVREGFDRVVSMLAPPVKGSGAEKEEPRSLSSFSSVTVDGAFLVDYHPAAETAVRVRAQQNILPLVSSRVVNGELKLSFSRPVKPAGPVRVSVTAPSLSAVTLNGSGMFSGSGMKAPALALSAKGSGTLRVSGAFERLDARLSGSGAVDVSGSRAEQCVFSVTGSGSLKADALTGRRLRAEVLGSGSIRAAGRVDSVSGLLGGSGSLQLRDMQTNEASIDVTGSGSARVQATRSARIGVAGSGSVVVAGGPARRETQRTGSGSIQFE